MANRPDASRKGVGGRPRGEPTTVIRLPVGIASIARRMAQRSLRRGDISAFLDVEAHSLAAIPLAGATAPCGFPSPADDHLESPLDFNQLLVRNPAATFAVRLVSETMTGVGLMPGDIAVVDRSVTPKNGDVVLALLDSEFTVKRLHQQGARVTLKAANPAYPDIEVGDGQAFEVWGVVTSSVRVF